MQTRAWLHLLYNIILAYQQGLQKKKKVSHRSRSIALELIPLEALFKPAIIKLAAWDGQRL